MKFFLLFSTLLSWGVMANDCAMDIQRFCAGVIPGKGQLTKCLYANKDNLSRACSAQMGQEVSTKDSKNPCHDNLVEFCSEMPLQGERLTYCLLKNENKLDQDCSKDFKPKKERFLGNNPCAPEIVEHCYTEVKGPEAMLTKCLIRNRTKASKTCQPHLEKLVARVKRENSCFDEIEKHCPTMVRPSEIQSCLEKKSSTLTPACKAAVDKQAQKIKSHPCYQDINTICKTAQTPANRQKCLTANMAKLSPACKAHRESRAGKMKKVVEACEADRVKFCKMAPRSFGKVLKCLKLNESKISPTCRSVL